jgi:hypothetical protein
MNNWIDIQELGIVCPVCGKSDLCAVTIKHIEHPTFAVCRRIKEGCYGTMRDNGGYLHILSKNGAHQGE